MTKYDYEIYKLKKDLKRIMCCNPVTPSTGNNADIIVETLDSNQNIYQNNALIGAHTEMSIDVNGVHLYPTFDPITGTLDNTADGGFSTGILTIIYTKSGNGTGNQVPNGGTVSQVLTKLSSVDGNTGWSNILKDSASLNSIDYTTRTLYDTTGNITGTWNYPTAAFTIGARSTGTVGINTFSSGTNNIISGLNAGAIGTALNIDGEGSFGAGTVGSTKGRSAAVFGRGGAAWGQNCFSVAGNSAKPILGDGSMGSNAIVMGSSSVSDASRTNLFGNRLYTRSWGESTFGWGNASPQPFSKDIFDTRDILWSVGCAYISDFVANDAACTAGQSNKFTIWKTGNLRIGKTTGVPVDNGYSIEMAEDTKFSARVLLTITNNTAVPFPDNAQSFIHTGGVATLTLPDPTLAINTGREIAITNMGTGDLTLSYPVYLDALTTTTLLSFIYPNNSLTRVICYNNSWYSI